MLTSKQCRPLGTTNTKFTNLSWQHSKDFMKKRILFLAVHHVTRSLSLKDRLSSTLQNDMENLRKDQQLRQTFVSFVMLTSKTMVYLGAVSTIGTSLSYQHFKDLTRKGFYLSANRATRSLLLKSLQTFMFWKTQNNEENAPY